MAPFCAPATLSPDSCTPHTPLSNGQISKVHCMDAEEVSSTAFPRPSAPSCSQRGKIPLPCVQNPAAPSSRERSSSAGTSLSPTQAAMGPLPLAGAEQLSSEMERRSSSACPPASVSPADAAGRPKDPAAAPADTMDSSSSSSILARDRLGSGSKWEPLWARTAVVAAAAALSQMTRSRASSCVSKATYKEDKDEGDEGEGVTQPQPPVLPPCRTSGSDAQHHAAAALPHSLYSSSSSTPTSFPVATLLSQSLLQALGSLEFPGSPRASAVLGKKAAPEQNQHAIQSILSHGAAARTEPATAEELSREVVLACEASGMATEDAQALVHLLLSQPGMNMDDLVAALSPSLHGLTAGPHAGQQQQQQQQQDRQQQQNHQQQTREVSLGMLGSTVPLALLPSHSISRQLKPKGPDPLLGCHVPSSSNSSFTSSISSSLPVCINSDLLSSQDGGGGTAGNSLSSCTSSHSCVLEEVDWKQGSRRADDVLPVYDAAVPIGAPKPPPQVAASATPHTPWNFKHLLGLLEQQDLSRDANKGATTEPQGINRVHGGKQVLSMMEQHNHQHRQNAHHQGADDLHGLQVHASSPTSRLPTVPSAHSLALLDAFSTSPSLSSTLSAGGSTATATALLSPSSSRLPTTDGKVGKGWEDMEEGVRERVFSVCEGCAPHVKLHHFDAGVRHWLVQLTALFGQEAAIKGLNGVVCATNLEGVRNMRAFITTRLIDHHEQLVFQKDPRGYAQRRLMPEQFEMLVDLVEGRSQGLLWSHFDPKVLDTMRNLCADYTRSRLERLSAKELSTVKNVPAYIFTLLSKRGKTARQAAAAKGAVEGAISRFTDAYCPPSMAPRIPARCGQPFLVPPTTTFNGIHPPHAAGPSPLDPNTTDELFLTSYYNRVPGCSQMPPPPPPPRPPPSRSMAYHHQPELYPSTPAEAPLPPRAYCSMAPTPHTLIYTQTPFLHHSSEPLLHNAPMGLSPCDPSFTPLYYTPANSYDGCMSASSDAAALPFPAYAPESHPNSSRIAGSSYNGSYTSAKYKDSNIPNSTAFTAYGAPQATCGSAPPQLFFFASLVASGGHAPFEATEMETRRPCLPF